MNVKRSSVLASMTLLCVTAFAESPVLSFRSQVPGTTTKKQLTEQLSSRGFNVNCDDTDPEGLAICSGFPAQDSDDELGGYYYAAFYKDVLAYLIVSFSHESWKAISEGFRLKYGQPGSTRRVVYQNAMGMRVTGSKLVWLLGGRTATLTEFSDKLDESDVFISDTKRSAQYDAITARREKESSRKLIE